MLPGAVLPGPPASPRSHPRHQHVQGDGAARTPVRVANPTGSNGMIRNPFQDRPKRYFNCGCGDCDLAGSPCRGTEVPCAARAGAWLPRTAVQSRASLHGQGPNKHRHDPAAPTTATFRHRLHLKEPRGPPPASRPSAADRRTMRRGRSLAALPINIHENAAAGAPLPGPESEKLAEALPRSTRGSGGAIAAGAPGSRRGTQRGARTGRLAVTRGAVRSGGRQKEPLRPPQLRPRRCPPARGGGSPAPPGLRDASACFTAPPGGCRRNFSAAAAPCPAGAGAAASGAAPSPAKPTPRGAMRRRLRGLP